ncbi:MAG TPA: hypothetical protein VHT73_02260 [Thermodesulfobacteriota bacterium]|nr:hypothetical protein [Thermodesulfobacteriota bacterium]
MRLSKEAIEEFKEIYRKKFGEVISDEEAYEKGLRLLRLFKLIYQSNSGKEQGERKEKI